ncbi:transcriptional regulator [Pseudomonas tohonis]|uniref:transcriptional regulator n=1 Tax=Pseudomonas tohonis TaxID=2725477 RepID=UPI0035A24ADA
MDFPTYLKQLPRGGKKRLAKSLGIPATYLSRLISGDRAITAERAMHIERATEGKVSRHELRPDLDWEQVA